MSGPLVEHQINHLIFGDIERFMAVREVPANLSGQKLTPFPYMATVGDVDIGFLSLFRSTGPGRAVAMVIQYTVRIGGEVVVSLIRSAQNPAYGMLHYRKAHAGADLKHLQDTLVGPRDYREMTRAEVEQFSKDAQGLDKKQIRIMPG